MSLGQSKAAFAFIAAATACTPALAQVWPTDLEPAVVPVYEMSRPFYNPPPIKLGAFQLLPSITESVLYDSNIFASGNRLTSDLVNRTTETLSLGSRWTQQSLNARIFATQDIYTQHASNNGYTWGGELSGRDDITGDALLQLDAGFVQQPLVRGTPEAGGEARRPVFNAATVTPSYVQRFDHLVNRLQFSLRDLAYISEQDATRSATRYGVADRASYDFSSALAPFLQISYAAQDWHIRPEQRDFDIMTGIIGLNVRIPNLLQLDFGVGVLHETFRNSAFNDLSVPVASGNLLWNVLPLTSIIGSVDRTVIGTETFCDSRRNRCTSPTGDPLPGESSTAPSRNTLDTTVGEIGLQHEFWHDLLGEARFRYQRDHFDFNGLTDETFLLALNGRFLVNRHLEADFDYVFRTRTANYPNDRTFNTGPFSDHVISITLKAAP